MRQISMALTTEKFLAGEKDVTRLKGWKNLKVGEHLMAVEKGQGLKKGEKVRRLGEIEVLEVNREPLHAICDHPGDVEREGFPGWTNMQFIEMYCKHNGGTSRQIITRIVFEKVKPAGE